jgi:hypothetical protein
MKIKEGDEILVIDDNHNKIVLRGVFKKRGRFEGSIAMLYTKCHGYYIIYPHTKFYKCTPEKLTELLLKNYKIQDTI